MDGTVFTIISKRPIKFPGLCANCGAHTDTTLSIRAPIDYSDQKSSIALNLAHAAGAGFFVGLVHLLDRTSVRIPCCERCRRPARIGSMLSWIAFTMPWICFYIIAYHPGALPESVEMVLFFIGLLLIASFMIPVYFGKKMALPVKVSRTSNSYTYTFYSGALKDFADQMDTGQGGS